MSLAKSCRVGCGFRGDLKYMQSQIPLYRALSKLGYSSRTEAVNLITSGAIFVDGKQCFDPEYLVQPDTTSITDGTHQITRETLRVLMLYKPRGVITSRKDEQGRPTIYSLLPSEHQKLHCVGRLDFATSGLLLLTNNTMLSAWLTDPQNGVPRVYIVTVRGHLTQEKADRMLSGIVDDGQLLKSDAVIVRKTSNRESHLVITLSEGKNREVRRLCSSVGHEVTKLKRVSYGPLTLGNLAPGQFREVEREELCNAFPSILAADIQL
jgi:23S rRNA pseudouridine2605 synthase